VNCSLPDGKPGNQEQEKAHLEKAQEFGYKPWLLKQLSPRPLTDQQHDVLLDGLAQRRPTQEASWFTPTLTLLC